MQFANPAHQVQLTPRAREQLTSLAADREHGYARLRVISRVRNKLQAEAVEARQKLADFDQNEARLKALSEGGRPGAAEALDRSKLLSKQPRNDVALLSERIERLVSEEAAIQTWLNSVARLVEGVVEHLGASRIHNILPDFGIELGLE